MWMTISIVETIHGAYEISTDPARVHIDAVYDFLSNHAYWSLGRSRQVVETSIANSGLICAAYVSDGELVAFSRMVTDLATFAWLCDVYVLPDHRGHGLGTAGKGAIVEHPEMSGVKRQVLATSDAHGLYSKFGYKAMDAPDRWMLRSNQSSKMRCHAVGSSG